ncbi:MAG: hypothetical protein GX962_16770 [Epulopiscium sp.]|nr:hypothetical protein [Candidatus Epulonipiscium sp.]
MNKKVRPILFSWILLSIAMINVFTPTKVFSSKENRYLQELPKVSYKKLISGEFGKEFEIYTTDQFVGRNYWISLKTISDLIMLKKDNTRVYFGKEHYLFDVDKEIEEEQFIKNINVINEFIREINEYNKNISMTALLIPKKSEILKDKVPLYAPIINEEILLEKIKLSLYEELQVLDVIDVLNEKSKEDIYYKTDHHWTTKGAFYTYQYYLEKIGEKPLEEKDFLIKEVSNNFLGTSYRKANFYLDTPDKIYSYIPKKEVKYQVTYNHTEKSESLYDEIYLGKTDQYSYFLSGDTSLIEIETSIENDKSIVVIKDSFANSLIPFLANHYKNIIVIDPRYFNMKIINYVKEKEVDEILFVFNIQNFIQEKSFSMVF